MVEKDLLILGVLGGMVIACQPSRDASSAPPPSDAGTVVETRPVVEAGPVADAPRAAVAPPSLPATSNDEPAETSATPAASSSSAPPPIPADVAKTLAFIERLPTCPPHRTEVSVENALVHVGSSQTQSVHGRLIPVPEGCTEMECGGVCCNACNGGWTLASASGSPRIALPMQWAVHECDLGATLARLRAGTDVIATGKLRAAPSRPDGVQARMPDAQLCVLRAGTAPSSPH